MRKLIIVLLLVVSISFSLATNLEINYPQEVVVYDEVTRFNVEIQNKENNTEIILPILEEMGKGLEVGTFTPILLPFQKTYVELIAKKPIKDGTYNLKLEVRNNDTYVLYDTIPIRIKNPPQTLRVVNYTAKLNQNETQISITLENVNGSKTIFFEFVISDLEGGYETSYSKYISDGLHTYNFTFNFGRQSYNIKRLSSFKVKYNLNGRNFSLGGYDVHFGNANEYIATVKGNEVVYDVFVDKETYLKLNKTPPITGYTAIRSSSKNTFCTLYSKYNVYDKLRAYVDKFPNKNPIMDKLLQPYDTLNFKIKNKFCLYPEKTPTTILLLMIIIGLLLLMGLRAVEPYELY